MVSFTVILRPFQVLAALAMSLPTVFGDRPRGPLLGSRADVAPMSPSVHSRFMTLILLRSNLAAQWRRLVSDDPNVGQLEKVAS